MSDAWNVRTATSVRYTVEGYGEFPLDMLRRDRAEPASAEDKASIALPFLEASRFALRRVCLVSDDVRGAPLTPRWESMGWRVVECDNDLCLSLPVLREVNGPRSCRTCRFLDVAPNAAGKIRPTKGSVYACSAPLPEMPALPDSITTYHAFTSPTHRRWMQPDDGASCPTFARRTQGASRKGA